MRKPSPRSRVRTALWLALTLGSPGAAQDQPIQPTAPPDLVAHWTFDTDTHSSVGSWTGELLGDAAVGQPDPRLGSGCYRNDGDEGFLQTNLQAIQRNDPQSISLWFRTNEQTGYADTLFGWSHVNSSNTFDVGLIDGRLSIRINPDSATLVPPTPLNDREWHHLILSRPGGSTPILSNTKVYLDGKLVERNLDRLVLSPATLEGIRIGSGAERSNPQSSTGRDFQGALDDFALFNSSLDAADAALLNGLARIAGTDAGHLQRARYLHRSPIGAVAEFGGREWMRVSGLPGTPGDWGGSLDDGDAWIVTLEDGGGIRLRTPTPPAGSHPFELTPLAGELPVREAESGTGAPHTVTNTAAERASWKAALVDGDGHSGSLESLLERWIETSPTILSSLPEHEDFEGGITGAGIPQEASVYNPAHPIFNGGNLLTTDLGGPIAYSDLTINHSAALGENGRYFTLKLPGLFLFAGDCQGATRFNAGGSTTRSRAVETYVFPLVHAGNRWKAVAVVRSTVTSSPSVHQLYLIDDPNAWEGPSEQTNTTSLNIPITFTGDRRILYAVFVSDTRPEPQDLEDFARTLLGTLPQVPRGIEVTPATGELAPGAQASLQVTANAENLVAGEYPLFLDLRPANQPADPSRSAIRLRVDEALLDVPTDAIHRATLAGGDPHDFELTLDSRNGNPEAWTAALTGGDSTISLLDTAGTTPSTIRLRFTPTSNFVAGDDRDVLELRIGASVHRIPIRHTYDRLNPTNLFRDPIRPRCYALNRGTHGSELIVVDPEQGDILKVIPVPDGASDLAFRPDGSEIFIFGSYKPEIARIDAESLEVLERFYVPGEYYQFSPGYLDVTREGMVPYVSNQALRIWNPETSEASAPFRATDLVRPVGSRWHFGDLLADPAAENGLWVTRFQSSTLVPGINRLTFEDGSFQASGEIEHSGPNSPYDGRIYRDLSGRLLFHGINRTDLAAESTEALYESTVHDVSSYGDLVLTHDEVLDGSTGATRMSLPADSVISCFTPDDRAVLYYTLSGNRFLSRALPASIRPPEPAIHPTPSDGGALEAGTNVLRWTALPLVEGYRVYFGTDRTAVENAGPGSPLDKGIQTDLEYAFDPDPTAAAIYWRVDAIRGDQVVPGRTFEAVMAAFRVTPGIVELKLPDPALAREFVLSPVDQEGRPISWSASTATPWIGLSAASGAAGEELVLHLDPAGLDLGLNVGSVTVSHGSHEIPVPVRLELFQADLDEFLADPARPIVYGLDRGPLLDLPGAVARIDATTGKFIDSLPLGDAATTFIVHPREDRLYVLLRNEARIQVFDLAEWRELPSIHLEGDISLVGPVAPGPRGRLFLQFRSSPGNPGLVRVLDTTSGTIVGTLTHGGQNVQAGEMVSDPSGTTLYLTLPSHIEDFALQLAVTGTLATEMAKAPLPTNNSGQSINGKLVVSHDGSRVAIGHATYHSDLRLINASTPPVVDLSPDGQLMLADDALHWTDTGLRAANRPTVDSPLGVFVADGNWLVEWDRTKRRAVSHRVRDLVPLPPNPLPGIRMEESPGELSWPLVEGATHYRVYLGNHVSAIEQADPDAEYLLGSPAQPALALDTVLPRGGRYFWRIDAVTPTGLQRGEVYFFDLPFLPESQPIVSASPSRHIEPYFGDKIEVSDSRVIIPDNGRLAVFDWNPADGSHLFRQYLGRPYAEEFLYLNFGPDVADDGTRILVPLSNPSTLRSENNARMSVHQLDDDGQWRRKAIYPFEGTSSLRNVGSNMELAGDHLLVAAPEYYESRGRILTFSEKPDRQPGPDLVPSILQEGDRFGFSLESDGNRVLVGAPGETGLLPKGSAYLFERDLTEGEWHQAAHLNPLRATVTDGLGETLALSGRHAALGTGGHTTSTSRVRPDRIDVQLFTRNESGAWQPSGALSAWDVLPVVDFGLPTIPGRFGHSLALSGDLLFVGAPDAWLHSQKTGAVLPYRYEDGTWHPLAPIYPPVGYEDFGHAIAARNGWLFVNAFPRSTIFGSEETARVLKFRIDTKANLPPFLIDELPSQGVQGRPMDVVVTASDPDGEENLVMTAAALPSGLTLVDEGRGRARIQGTPSSPVGTSEWVTLRVTDGAGGEAIRSSRFQVLAADDLPVLQTFSETLRLKEGEDLELHNHPGGTGPFTFRWSRDEMTLPFSGPTLLLPDVGLGDAGRYQLEITNTVGSVQSGEVLVEIRPADRTAGPWTTEGSGGDHDGRQPARLGRHRFQAAWGTAVSTEGFELHPATIGDGLVFATIPSEFPALHAYDLETGELRWSRPYDESSWISQPAWFDGSLYLDRRDWEDNSTLFGLKSLNGSVRWQNDAGSGFHDMDSTPVAGPDGIFFAAAAGGIRGYTADGSESFALHDDDEGFPTLSGGRLFSQERQHHSYEGQFLRERDPETGELLWEEEWASTGIDTIPVVKGHRAYLIGANSLVCLDTVGHRTVWEVDGRFSGVPALARDRVYVLADGEVSALSTEDGSLLASYETGFPLDRQIRLQPIVLNDHLVVPSRDATLIFHLESSQAVQTLRSGGHAAYSGNHLVLAGFDGTLRAYLANTAPAFDDTTPTEIAVPAAADDLALDLSSMISDADSADTLVWSILSVSRPEIFRVLELDPANGNLTVVYNPWQSGESLVTLGVEDSAGNVTRTDLRFQVPTHPLPELEHSEELLLNRQTGLYEHTITVTNRSAREVAGFDLIITNLPEGVCLNNASDCDGSTWVVEHRQPVAVAASVTLVLEYFAPLRGTLIDPTVTVRLVTEPEDAPAATQPGLAIDRCEVLPDGLLIEFSSTPGRLYEVQYSDDMADWKVSPTRIRSASNRTQWIDRGPPRTDSPPAATSKSRYYRVLELSESPSE